MWLLGGLVAFATGALASLDLQVPGLWLGGVYPPHGGSRDSAMLSGQALLARALWEACSPPFKGFL